MFRSLERRTMSRKHKLAPETSAGQIGAEGNFRVGDHSPTTQCTPTLLLARRTRPVVRKRVCRNPRCASADRFASVHQTGGVLASSWNLDPPDEEAVRCFSSRSIVHRSQLPTASSTARRSLFRYIESNVAPDALSGIWRQGILSERCSGGTKCIRTHSVQGLGFSVWS